VDLWESVRIAFRALRGNKMRTALTMLGIVIGVGAVIAMIAIGQGAARKISQQFASMGTNLLTVRTGNPQMRFGGGGPVASTAQVTSLVPADADAILDKCKDSVSQVAQVSRGNGTVKMGAKNYSTNIVGATPEYGEVAKWSVEQGRFIETADQEGRTRVAVVGRSVVEHMTDDRTSNPIGQNIALNRTNFEIVGILKEKGSGAFGQDQDDIVIIPCSTAMRRVFNRNYLSEIDVSCRTEDDMPLATEQIVSLMRERHKLLPPFPDNDDFNVRSQAEILQASAASSATMTSLLGGIALVSLLVGGIGIMNIMLVSVTERTREIGIRKAVGATSHDILTQFLVEALIITTIGGLVGVGLGVGIAAILASVLAWDVVFQAAPIIISVVVSAGVGIFFGIYPARKAANLNPIEALRYE
jgi:putative ABC transport system permease protein